MRTESGSLAGVIALAAGIAAALAGAFVLAASGGEVVPGWPAGLAFGLALVLTALLLRRFRRLAAAVESAETRQRQSERFSEALMEHSSDLIAVLNPDGTVRFASPSHQRVLGYAPEELIGRNAFDLVHPDDQPGLLETFARGIGANGPVVSREFRFRHKNGSWRVVEAAAQAVLDDPVIAGAVINSRDVTARRRAEDALRDSARWLELLLSQMPAAVWTVDRELRFTSTSGAALQRLGLESDGALGRALTTYFGSDDPDALPLAAHRRALAGTPQDFEMQWNGRWFLTHVEPLRDQDGEIVGVVGVGQDVTESRRAERDKAALLEVAHDIAGTLELQEVLDRVGQRTAAVVPCDAVAVLRWDGVRETFRIISQVGVPTALLAVGQSLPLPPGFRDGRVPDEQTLVLNDLAERPGPISKLVSSCGITAVAATPLVLRGRRLGLLVAFKTQSRRFHPPQVQLLDSIGHQLTVAMEAADLYAGQREEAAVAAALARIARELISELDQPVLLERLCRLTVEELQCDVSRTYLLDRERAEYVPMASSGDSPEEWEAVRVVRIPQAQLASFPQALLDKDVVELDLPTNIPGAPPSPVSSPPRVLAMALRRGTELVGLHAARYLDRHRPCTAAQLRIARGIAQFASLALENARLVEELDRANRVKADFVASMSHELRTPLNVIIGYSDLLVDQMFGELSAEQQETVRRVGEQGRELLELVNTTLDMSRLESGRVAVMAEDVDLVNLLAEIELEAQLVRRNAALEVTWHVSPDVPLLWTDPVKLKVVIKNLLLNAIKFTDEGGVVVRAAARDGGVEIAVSDSGIGIAPQMIPRIFEAFRQGDHGSERRGGVGLGLHIVHRLLDMLGGSIEVESALQRGSTFRIWVPTRMGDAPSRRHDLAAQD